MAQTLRFPHAAPLTAPGSSAGWFVAFLLATALLVQMVFPPEHIQNQPPVENWSGNSGSLR